MAAVALLFALLSSSAFAAVQDEAKNRPVSKVITLLGDMVDQLTKESEEDQEVFEAMGCWCETNDKGKTKAIADGEQAIGELTAAIDSFTAKAARLNTEIANLNKEVAANSEALEKATAVRKKELAEFNAEEKESLQTISSLKGAVTALSKHHQSAFLQTDASSGASTTSSSMDYLSMVANIQHSMHKHHDVVSSMLMPSQRKTLSAFLQNPDEYFNAPLRSVMLQSPHAEYAPASGEIFGLMKQMKEEFETNLASSQKDETTNQADFEGLKASKTEEIAAGESQIEAKSEELGDTDSKNAESKTLLAETRKTLAADIKFLANLKEHCANVDAEYAQRVKTRQLEIQAVSKAKAFLSSDDAQDLVARSLNFVQTRQTALHSQRRTALTQVLSRAAQVSGDPRMSALAVRAKLDAFTKVKASIQTMVDQLAEEQEEEVKHKDFCVDSINTNEKDTQNKNQQKQTHTETIGDREVTMDKMTKAIAALNSQISDLQVQLKRASEDREKQNKEFQTTVADQRATQKLLAGAQKILKGFYEKESLIQKRSTQEPAGPPPPPGFKKYENNAQSGGVMAMIQQIIDDAKAMEADALKAEEESQIAYETLVTDTNNSVETKRKEITSSTEMRSKAESDKVEAEQERDVVMEELEVLSKENADLHESCDYTLKNFDLRQGARQAEMEALKQALSLLNGAAFSAFLQK